MSVGACGVSCEICRLFVYGVCEGCSPGDTCTPEKAVAFSCAILKCAQSKSIPYCLRDCIEYPCSLYKEGSPVCGQYLQGVSALPPHQNHSAWTSVDLRTSDLEPSRLHKSSKVELYVFCLGPFRVHLKGRTISDADWGQGKGPSQKVKALFACLVAKGRRGATKEELAEVLWPGERWNDSLTSRFHAAIHYLRRALEPGLSSHSDSAFIVLEESHYRLAGRERLWVDSEAFIAYYEKGLRLARQGMDSRAARLWKLAEALYQGEYMAGIDSRYTEGFARERFEPHRYRLRSNYLALLLELAGYHYDQGQIRLARLYAEKAIKLDPGCEEACRLLMRVHHTVGQRGEVYRQFQQCERFLRHAEDRDPEPATRLVLQELTS